MAENKLQAQDIKQFDPSELERAMSILKDCIKLKKDEVQKYKSADLTAIDMDKVFYLAHICHEITAAATLVLLSSKDCDEIQALEFFFLEYSPENLKNCFETCQNIDNLKIITEVMAFVDFDENGYPLDDCRKALNSMQNRLRVVMERGDLFNQKMLRTFDATYDLIENLEDLYKSKQFVMMAELSDKYPECRGAKIYEKYSKSFNNFFEQDFDEDDDFDEDWDGDEDIDIEDDIITLDSVKDFKKYGINEDDLVAANYIKDHLKKFKK